jgi:hypothetical protein
MAIYFRLGNHTIDLPENHIIICVCIDKASRRIAQIALPGERIVERLGFD